MNLTEEEKEELIYKIYWEPRAHNRIMVVEQEEFIKIIETLLNKKLSEQRTEFGQDFNRIFEIMDSLSNEKYYVDGLRKEMQKLRNKYKVN